MSWSVTLRTLVKDTDAFNEACLENGLTLRDDLTIYKGSQYIGKLKEDKKDADDFPTYQLVTDSDYIGKGRSTNVEKVMQLYSEKICYRRIGSIGTILERIEETDGSIILKVAVNA